MNRYICVACHTPNTDILCPSCEDRYDGENLMKDAIKVKGKNLESKENNDVPF